jgi:hypothetical protein
MEDFLNEQLQRRSDRKGHQSPNYPEQHTPMGDRNRDQRRHLHRSADNSRNQQIVLDVDYLVGEAAQLMALGAGTARRGQATAVPRELSSTG